MKKDYKKQDKVIINKFVCYSKQIARKGLKDNFNAFMLKEASYEGNDDIPICPSTMTRFPTKIITFEEAKQEIKRKKPDFKATICFSKDDYKFDSNVNGIWVKPYKWLKFLSPFEAVVQPDFSTCQDFPKVLSKYNTYRMRAVGCFLINNGIPVINNYRASGKSSFDYCTDGIPKNSLVFISTYGCIKDKCNYKRLKYGLEYLIIKKRPSGIVIYGKAPKDLCAILEKNKISYRVYKTELDRRLEAVNE